MNIILVAINAKFIHSCLAIYSLYVFLDEAEKKHVSIKEFTVNHSEDLIISELFDLKPDVLAFSCYIWNITMVLSLVQTFKKILPETKIVVGGPEVSYESGDLYDYGVDIVVPGEGEQAFKSLVRGFLSREVLSLARLQDMPGNFGTKKGADFALADTSSFSDNSFVTIPLEDIPFPYTGDDAGLHNFGNRIIYYETSRGCPNQCGFCLSSVTQGVRFLPMDRVRWDLSAFLSTKVHQVKFVDRTFNCDKKHAVDIWSYLMENDNGVTNFHFEIGGGLLDDEMIRLVGQARKGLFQFEIGVQSTNPDTLTAIRRSVDNQKLFENIRKLKALGNVHLHLDLIVGLPYEDYPSFIRSFNDVMVCFPPKLQVGFLKLLKGSNLRENAAKYGIQFKGQPPYEILSNHYMGFETINKLKKIENMVDMFYNSGGYHCFAKFMCLKFDSPFDFFDALSVYWEQNGYHLFSHKKAALYTILYEFGKRVFPSDAMVISELLKFDMLMKENIRTFPQWIDDYYHYDHKQITRTTGIHIFKYDICGWLRQEEKKFATDLQKKEIKVRFDYTRVDEERYSHL